MTKHQRSHGAHGVIWCFSLFFQGISSSCAVGGLAKLPGANSPGALLLKPSKTIGGWSDVAPAAPTRDGKSQGTPWLHPGRRVPSCSLGQTKAKNQKLLGRASPNISKPDHFKTDFKTLSAESTSPHKPPVHNGAQQCTRNGPRRHRLSWHHATAHTTTATLLNGFLRVAIILEPWGSI